METSLDWYNKWTIFLQTFNFEFILLYFANFNNLWLIILSERVSTSASTRRTNWWSRRNQDNL